jgi:DUF4097 and DUF4098 domain-containing protein YvlB
MKSQWMLLPLTLLILPAVAKAGIIEKQFTVEPGKKLVTDLKASGTIEILGWDKDIVAVKADLRGRDAQDVHLDMEARPFGVSIETSFDHHRRNSRAEISLEIHVPKKFDLELETMGGGISVENVEGMISGKTMGGKLELHGLKGQLDLLTMGGSIRLTNSDVGGKVKTMGGTVEVEGVTGGVKASSQGGNVTYRNEGGKSTGARTDEVDISTMGGAINVDDAPNGANVNTMGGNIHIRSAAQFARAKTMGGDIEIDAVDGWVEATTMGGDVTVTMTGDPADKRRDVQIASMHGDVTLTIPPSLSADFDIELAFTKGNEGRYKIESDFPLDQKTSPEWDEDHGSPRKYTTATGTNAGGKNAVKVKTVNGDIHIKRASM